MTWQAWRIGTDQLRKKNRIVKGHQEYECDDCNVHTIDIGCLNLGITFYQTLLSFSNYDLFDELLPNCSASYFHISLYQYQQLHVMVPTTHDPQSHKLSSSGFYQLEDLFKAKTIIMLSVKLSIPATVLCLCLSPTWSLPVGPISLAKLHQYHECPIHVVSRSSRLDLILHASVT